MTALLGLAAGALWGYLCARRDWGGRAMLIGALAIAILVALARHGHA